jgi:tripartite-type tricarboxylate transporter receptor subunit TctC
MRQACRRAQRLAARNESREKRPDAAAMSAPTVTGHVKAGTLRAIATGTTTRLPQLPDVPTVAESGMPGFEMTQWYGLLAPASMPKPNQDKLAAATQAAVKSAAMKGRLAADAALAAGGTSAEFAAFIAAEQKRWQPVIQRAPVKRDRGTNLAHGDQRKWRAG